MKLTIDDEDIEVTAGVGSFAFILGVSAVMWFLIIKGLMIVWSWLA